MKILGKFTPDTRFTIVETEEGRFALLNLKEDGTYDQIFEWKQFAPGLGGIEKELNKKNIDVK